MVFGAVPLVRVQPAQRLGGAHRHGGPWAFPLLIFLWFLLARPFRWRFQFSIRLLLVLALVVAIVGGWLAAERQRAAQQRDAVAAVRALGGDVYYDYEHYGDPPRNWPPFPSAPGEPPGPAWARRLPGVDFLADAVAVRFADPTYYGSWDIELYKIRLTDVSLDAIVKLSRLERLDLGSTRIAGCCLEKLNALKRLRELGLDVTGLADAGLEGVGKLRSLQVLSLSSCKITDAGLGHITGLSGLRELNLIRTHVTDEGVRKLQGALPKCSISYNGHPAAGGGKPR